MTDLYRPKAFIDGDWCDAEDGSQFSVMDPATGKEIAQIANCSGSDAERAIASAKSAFIDWSKQPAKHRSAILTRWAELLLANEKELAELLSRECGKPITEAIGEIRYGASYVSWFAEEAERVYGETVPAPASDRRIVILKQPVGVVAAITPWNFPNAMITRKVAPALAAGCTVVVKPAEATPLSALAAAALALEAGLPKGAFNVIPCEFPQEIGNVLSTHEDIRKISFTGSTGIGSLLLGNAAKTIKRSSMELGGDAPFIVFEDADIDAAVEGAMVSKYRNAGQTCVCANRMLVHQDIAEEFSVKLAQQVASLKVGNGLEEGTDIGPLINAAAMEKVDSLVRDAVKKGAKLLTGGAPHEAGPLFFEPTVLSGVTRNMKISGQEIFGPVAPIIEFGSETEAIEIANDTPFGLAAYFFTNDLGRSWRVSEALEYGMVALNTGALSNVAAPFGGVKQSGIGREGSHHGINEYLELKYVCMAGLGS